MGRTKIDWCDRTANPVIGCGHGCPFCYARKCNERFHWIDDFSKPKWFPKELKHLGTNKPTSFFMDSLSDIAYWPTVGIFALTQITSGWSRNAYIFLTKDISSIDRFKRSAFDTASLKNLYFGYSCGSEDLIRKALTQPSQRLGFLSVEPILDDLTGFSALLDYDEPEFVIIGAETGSRKGKVKCDPQWVRNVVDACDKRFIHVFMKDSLKKVMGTEFRRDKLPWPCSKEGSYGK